MIGVIDFFKELDKAYKSTYLPGQIFYVPVSFMMYQNVNHLKLDYFDSDKPNNSSYIIEGVDIKSIKPQLCSQLRQLGLSDGEFDLVVRHKVRPVILLCETIPSWKGIEEKSCDLCIIVPLYSVRDGFGNLKFSKEFLLQIQAYKYPSLFLLPDSENNGIHNSIVRFDRLVMVNRRWLSPSKTSLSDDGYFCLHHWFNYFVTGILNCEFEKLLNDFIDEMQKISEQ